MSIYNGTKCLFICNILIGIVLLYFTYQKGFLTKELSVKKNLMPRKCGNRKMSRQKATPRIYWNTQCNGDNSYAMIVNLRSRLGNHIFQFASSLGIAYRNGLVPVYPHQEWSPVFKMFNLTMDLYESLPDSCKKYNNFNYSQHNHANIYDQHTEALGYISQHQKRNIYLVGFWENEKYFSNIISEIRKQFKFSDVIEREAKEFLREQMSKRFNSKSFTKVGVHLRLTDRGWEWKEKAMTYIQKAVSFYKKHYVNLLFVVCSDDISAARKLFPSNINIIYSDKFGDTPWVDMAVLTLCDHSIISVGTFGWWAAWLTGGKVVYLYDTPMFGDIFTDKDKLIRQYHLKGWVPL